MQHHGRFAKNTGNEETGMNEIGTFDILGPNMIGPSSSHTAGALRIAFIAGKMVEKRFV